MNCHPWRRVVWIPLLLSAGASCFKLDDDDCRSSSTCQGQLLAEYEAELGTKCANCLRANCLSELRECEKDLDCKQAVRCQLKDGPSAYQKCLSDLYARDASSSEDSTGAFEGKLGGFGECLDTRECAVDCKLPDWTCKNSESAYSINGAGDLVLSVQYYRSSVEKADRVPVSLCRDPKDCSDLGESDGGLIRKQLDRTVGRYFQLQSPPDAGDPFPKTLFYPGCIGTDGPQPVPLYIVRNVDVEIANEMLTGRNEVFQDAGQSIILPTSCHSAPGSDLVARGVKIGVKGRPLDLCKDTKQLPCVWYGDPFSGLPDLDAGDTSGGTTAGIAGLEPGLHDLVACYEGKLVAEREVLMQGGQLTIARMLPIGVANADRSVCDHL